MIMALTQLVAPRSLFAAALRPHGSARTGWTWLAVAACTLATLPAQSARAFPGRFDGVPNGAVLRAQWMATPGTQCTLCHTVTAPGTCAAAMTDPCLNATFGTPFQTSGWTSTLATADLDGDGFTNGQELQDAAGAWVVGNAAPGVAAYVTAPQDEADHPGLHDADMDRVCWFGRDTNDDFLCDGAAERSTADRDCDDSNASRHTGAVELCDAADQDCDGVIDEGLTDCDPGVGSCGAGQGENEAGDCHPRELIDGDRDRYCHSGQDLSEPADWDCADGGEQNGESDCDEFDAQIAPSIAEACLDAQDDDCDALVDADDSDCAAYFDDDGDGFCPLGEDMDADQQCDTEAEADAAGRDCDDAAAAINPTASEECTSGQDEDCDGLLDGRDESCGEYRDEDRDGFCAAGRDDDEDFLCDGSGEPGAAVDCDDALPNVYEGAAENCIDERDNDCDGDADEAGTCVSDSDADEDGYCPLGRDLSDPLDGDCTDPGEDEAVSDCNDADEDTNPGRVEECSDRLDNDCDGVVDLADADCERLLDGDGDAYCPEGHDTNGDGDCLDFDEGRPIRDCDDGDPARRPRTGEDCTDGVDNDCNGDVDGFDATCTCDENAACPVSEPCMLGLCVTGRGCRVVPDPSCDDDDGGVPEPGSEDGGGRPGRDSGITDGGSNEPPELEDVGCGCRLAGTRRATGLVPALALALALLIRVRRRRRS
jgi:MYXO-CTERM domain-containing protein